MKVSEAEKKTSKQYEEARKGNLNVRNASRKQYLESARGHYISALAGRNCDKQEVIEIRAAIAGEDHASEEVTEAEHPAILEQPGQLKTFLEMDVQMKLPKGLFTESENQLQAIRFQLNKALARSATTQLAEVVDRLGVIGRGMGKISAADLEAMTTVSSDSGDATESLPKGMVEHRSLQKKVESLKAELENLKREHAEIKDNDVEAENAPKNCQLRCFCCKPEDESCLEEEKYRHAYEKVGQNKNELKDLKIRAKGLKRDYNGLKRFSKVEKKPRLYPNINEGKEGRMSDLDLSKSLPEKMNTVCVSTSESIARIANSEDDLESSSWRPHKPVNLEKDKMVVMKGRIEADKCDHASEFSIRDYVFSARKKDISTNWPFSHKNLQLCLKHGVQNVLPPFQPVDSLKNGFTKRCLAEKSVSSEESNLHERPSLMKSHLVRGITIDRCWNQEYAESYRDSYSFPSVGDKDFAFKTTAVNCQSEVESVCTSNLPFSEVVSDEQEVAVSAGNKRKSSVSQIPNKKCVVALKSCMNSNRGAPEDITSACTVPSEGMSSKICPVCENFSSSSNTTLNAHIDQCLSSESSPNWAKNSKLVKPRIKPRKMRSMVDIYVTAPRCTLEDLDKRNGSNWATNLDIATKTGLQTEGNNHRVSSRYIVNDCDDDSVYIDSNGRKIRIISKFNEKASSSFPKSRKDLKVTKQSKKGQRCKFFSAKRKRRHAKHLKYLRVTRQRKHSLSLNVKGCSTEACEAVEATCAEHESHMKHQSPTSFDKGLTVQKQKKQRLPGSSSSWRSRMTSCSNKNEADTITKVCRYDLRATKDLRVRSHHTVIGRTLGQKHSNMPKKLVSSLPRSLRMPMFDSAGAEHNKFGSSCRKIMGSPSPRSSIQGSRETSLVPLNSGAAGFVGESSKECVQKSLSSNATPASLLERDREIQRDADNSGSRKMLHGSHGSTLEGMSSYNSETEMHPPGLSNDGECPSTCKLKGSAIDNMYVCSRARNKETEASSADAGEASGTKRVYSQNGLKDTNRFSDHADGGYCNYGSARSVKTRHGKEFDDQVSYISLAIGNTNVRSNPSLDPELQKVADKYEPLSKTIQCLDNFQTTLFTDVSNTYFPQHGLRKEQMFFSDVSASDSSELKMGNAILNFGHGSSFVDVDPIPIPGPPGSDLPCFSDMDSEDLQRSSSSSSGLEQSFGDGKNVVCVDSSDPLLSATSSLSSLGVTYDNFCPGWLGAPSPDVLTIYSQSTAADRTEKVASVINDINGMVNWGGGQQYCFSHKYGIPWTAAMKFQESQHQGQRMTSLVTSPGEQYTVSSLAKWSFGLNDTISFSSFRRTESENLVKSGQTSHQNTSSVEVSAETAVQFPRAGDCDSTSPTPILRLMGKDVMVINKEEIDPSMFRAAQNLCMNKMHPVAEPSSKPDTVWEHHAPHSPVFMGPVLFEQDPH